MGRCVDGWRLEFLFEWSEIECGEECGVLFGGECWCGYGELVGGGGVVGCLFVKSVGGGLEVEGVVLDCGGVVKCCGGGVV